jgi:hypothetical protein
MFSEIQDIIIQKYQMMFFENRGERFLYSEGADLSDQTISDINHMLKKFSCVCIFKRMNRRMAHLESSDKVSNKQKLI